MNQIQQLARVQTIGKITTIREDIQRMSEILDAAPLWRPRNAIQQQCREIIEMINRMEARFDRKLVVTIIGPTGVGKSTFLNALAGADNLSASGHDRPTTKEVVVLCKDKEDARQLLDRLGADRVSLRASTAAAALEHVMFIDTPDTDSTEQEKHLPLVRNAIGLSDVLICMFNAENPKRLDYIDFLSTYVGLFQGDALMVVLNKCDRQNETELKQWIVPEFLNYIRDAWSVAVDTIWCISARNHLQQPRWDPDAPPMHGFDQFDQLKNTLLGDFNQAGYVVDRRIKNVTAFREYLLDEIQKEVASDAEALREAGTRLKTAEKTAFQDAITSLKTDSTQQALGVNVRLYQKLAQRWLGPLGWMIALWARILIFGSGLAAMFRFGNPIRQVVGMISAFAHFKTSQAALVESDRGDRAGKAIQDYRKAILRLWPDIAESLVAARFDPSVRNIDTVLPEKEDIGNRLQSFWESNVERSLEQEARKLSGIPLQLFFNLPTVGLLCHAGWITGKSYLLGNYLSSDVFLHAFLTIVIILFLSFFLFQGCVRLAASPERIIKKTFQTMMSGLEEFENLTASPVNNQIDLLLGFLGNKKETYF